MAYSYLGNVGASRVQHIDNLRGDIPIGAQSGASIELSWVPRRRMYSFVLFRS